MHDGPGPGVRKSKQSYNTSLHGSMHPAEATAWLQIMATRMRSVGSMQLLSELAGTRLKINAVHSTVLMSSAASFRQWQIARDLFDHSRALNLQIDAVLRGAAINAFQRAQRWESAVNELWPESNEVAYGAAISACHQAGKWKVTQDLFRDMLHSQIESNEQIISSLMAAGQWQASLSAQTKDPVTAGATLSTFNVWSQGLQQRLGISRLTLFEQHLVELNIYSYNTMINCCEKEWGPATKIFRHMSLRAVERNCATFNTLISCHGQASQWMPAIETATQLRHKTLRPSEVMTAVTCSACEKGRHWQLALKVMSTWRSKFSIGCVVSACEKCSQWAEALMMALHQGMTVVNAALSACEKTFLWHQALQLMQKHQMQCDIITWTAALTASAAAMAWGMTLTLLTRMLHEGVVPEDLAYDAAMSSLRSKWRAALECCDRMQQSHLSPLPVSLSTCIAATERYNAAASTYRFPCR
eukprot:symbB.v1.2.019643.t1/scaffold1584.1/size110534/2